MNTLEIISELNKYKKNIPENLYNQLINILKDNLNNSEEYDDNDLLMYIYN